MTPRVSVIVFSYNTASYLAECLESILDQTYGDFEVVVCDDASTDESWEIVTGYADRFPEKIRAHRHERNLGVGANVNSGIRRAQGELLTWVASDDRWRREKLAAEVVTHERSRCEVVYSGVIVIDPDGREIERRSVPSEARMGRLEGFERTVTKSFFEDASGLFRNMLVSRGALETVGTFDEGLELYEDWDLKIRLTARYPTAFSGIHAVEYRHRPGSARSTEGPAHVAAMKRVVEKNRGLIRSAGGERGGRLLKRVLATCSFQEARVLMSERKMGRAIWSLLRTIWLDPLHPGFREALAHRMSSIGEKFRRPVDSLSGKARASSGERT